MNFLYFQGKFKIWLSNFITYRCYEKSQFLTKKELVDPSRNLETDTDVQLHATKLKSFFGQNKNM